MHRVLILAGHVLHVHAGSMVGTPSGAYIFRPNGLFIAPPADPDVEVLKGPVLTEFRLDGPTVRMLQAPTFTQLCLATALAHGPAST